MKRAKKDRPKAGTFEQSRSGLAPGTFHMNIITVPGKKASPNLDGKGGTFPVTGWELLLAVCGTGCLVSGLFRLIDWMD